ncbi:gamma-glutamyl-gamma-aminobutyrate hydrolase [Kitasatospora herbaricolor]|uniref:gamma-glutamyl-gamma-aminobutyrate hydrolase family protein n=1 Tax=Kitasatospora herbaricolor TaxID=68217 RepID=UPI0019C2E34C|nr:putative glutamine amidotransferase [Kitasatospora herbaricolor]GGV38101.1 gamma-glutamyl-gamma-aminobutyrate hydrolase [Kitasatospora herbaricolor]
MRKPLIGISTYWLDSVVWNDSRESPAAFLPTHYVHMLQASGGTVLMLPPDQPTVAEHVVAQLDGLVIAGGPDVAPEHYGAVRDLRTGPPSVARDNWELALIKAAVATRAPLLGICRGMQLLNVSLGGTLVQHLDGHLTPGIFGAHPVNPIPGTLYHSLVPERSTVATYHHQAVHQLGVGLVPSALADDGTIEAIEAVGTQWVLGVQWHPEMGSDTRVLEGLVKAANRR